MKVISQSPRQLSESGGLERDYVCGWRAAGASGSLMPNVLLNRSVSIVAAVLVEKTTAQTKTGWQRLEINCNTSEVATVEERISELTM